MELYNNTLITDDLWDFIEANVPNYHERDDVMRQAQLQLLIDGHESPVAGITREEAILLRDNILHGLFAEAVAVFTAKQSVEVPSGISLHDYAETLADIAYECGTRRFRYGSDSRMKITRIVAWADEFSRNHAHTDWAKTEYLDKIDEFMQSKLSVFSTRSRTRVPCAARRRWNSSIRSMIRSTCPCAAPCARLSMKTSGRWPYVPAWKGGKRRCPAKRRESVAVSPEGMRKRYGLQYDRFSRAESGRRLSVGGTVRSLRQPGRRMPCRRVQVPGNGRQMDTRRNRNRTKTQIRIMQ